MGEKLRGYWTEKFPDAVSALKYCDEKHDELRKQVSLRNTRILRDGQRFGDDYCMLLSAAYREVIASHKLVKPMTESFCMFPKTAPPADLPPRPM